MSRRWARSFLVRRPELNQGKSPSRIGSGNIHQDEFLYSAVQESGQMTVFGIDGVPRKLTRLATHPLVNRPGWDFHHGTGRMITIS